MPLSRSLFHIKKYRYFLTVMVLLFAACSNQYKNPHIEIQTSQGDIEIELYPDQAPKSVAAFLFYIKAGYYKNCSFYRVLNTENQPSYAPKAEVIQGGLWANPNKRPELPGIPHETTSETKILHKSGVISFARNEPGTATTEFFICIGDQPGYDYGGENNPDKQGYAAFGKVISGMDIVQKIYHMPESDMYFEKPVDIYDIKRL
jgi:peptidyl-prolyl cis-trans isomerase A (cyclophilin A)